MVFILISNCRLYTSPKGWAYYSILSSTQTYEKIMKNNVDLETSFNSWDITIKKALTSSKSAIFADSTFLEWGIYWGLFSKHVNLPCLVRLSRMPKLLEHM